MAKPKTPRRSGRLATGKSDEKNEEPDDKDEDCPGFECAFPRCKINSDEHPDANFYEFPLDRPKLLAKWLSAINRRSLKPSKATRLCGNHFETEDFIEPKRKLRGDRGGAATDTGERVLKDTAVPNSEARSDASDSENSVKSESDKSAKSELEKNVKGDGGKNAKSASERTIKGNEKLHKFEVEKSLKSDSEKTVGNVKRKSRAMSNSTEGNDESDSEDGQVRKKLRKGKRISLPPGACAVSICENNMFDSQSNNLRFFRFPSNVKLSDAWKEKCGQEGINELQARVCSNHFTIEDFNTVTGPTANRNLKPDAVPSLNISKETMTENAGFPKRRTKSKKPSQSSKDEEMSDAEIIELQREEKRDCTADKKKGKDKIVEKASGKEVTGEDEAEQGENEEEAEEEEVEEEEEEFKMPKPMILPDEIKSEPVSETDEPEIEEIKPIPTSVNKRKQSLTLRKDDEEPQILLVPTNDEKSKKKTPVAARDRRVAKDDAEWGPGKRPPPRRNTTPAKPKKIAPPPKKPRSRKILKEDSDSDNDIILDSIISSKAPTTPITTSTSSITTPARLEKMITLVDQRYAGKDGASVPQQYKLVVKVPESMSVEPGQVVTLKGVLTGDSGFKVATPESVVPSIVAKVEEVTAGGAKAGQFAKVRQTRVPSEVPSTSKLTPKTAPSLRSPSLASGTPTSASVSLNNAVGAEKKTMVKELEKKYSFDELLQKYSEAITEKAVVHKNLTELTEAQKGLEKSLASQERTIQRANEKIASLERRISSIDESLSKFLTPNQLRLSMNEAKKVVWTAEEMLTAFTLCHLSKTTYAFLRNKLKFPLPKVEAVLAWEKMLLEEKTEKVGQADDSSKDRQELIDTPVEPSKDQVVSGDKRNAAGHVLDEQRTSAAKKSRYISVKRQQDAGGEELKKQSSLGKLLGSALSTQGPQGSPASATTTPVKEEPEVVSLEELNDAPEQVIDDEVTELSTSEAVQASSASVQYVQEGTEREPVAVDDQSYVVVEEGEDGTLKVSCVGGEPNEDIIKVVQQVLASGVPEYSDESPASDNLLPVVEPEQALKMKPKPSSAQVKSANETVYQTTGTSEVAAQNTANSTAVCKDQNQQQLFLVEGNLELGQEQLQQTPQINTTPAPIDNAYCVVLDGVEYFMDEESAKAFMLANGAEQFIFQEPVTQAHPVMAGGSSKKKVRGPDHSYCQVKSGRGGIQVANQQPPCTQNQ